MQPIRSVEIDFNVDDTAASVAMLIRRLAPLVLRETSDLLWHLDMTKCRYLGPDAAAVLGATVLDSRRRGKILTVGLPTSPSSLVGFCHFSGLETLLRGSALPDPSAPENETIPLRTFMHANYRDADPLIDLIRRHAGISVESEDYLRMSINEVTQNVEDHAQSPIGGLCCARFLRSRNQVRVAIVDFGRGIPQSLQSRYPDIHRGAMALARVTEGRFTAQSRPSNAGLGINWLWNIVGTLGGRIFILSGDGLAENISGKNRRIAALKFPFPGTGVFFTLPVDTDAANDA